MHCGWRLACLLLLLALASPAAAAWRCSPDLTQTIANVDGSRLRVCEIPAAHGTFYHVHYAAPGSGFVILKGGSFDFDAMGEHYQSVRFVDLDTVGADLGSEDDNAPARCTFQRRSGDNWQVITPPGPAWLSLCETYGDSYHLVTPEEAQAAEAAAQEQ